MDLPSGWTAALAPVEIGREPFGSCSARGERQIRGNGRLAIRRKPKISAADEDGLGEHSRQDGQRIDPCIENAKATGFKNPVLPRMPLTNVFFPGYRKGPDRFTG